MKIIFSILGSVLLAFLTCGCGKKEDTGNPEDFHWQTDYPAMNVTEGSMLETDTGYYLYQMAGGKIFYSDKEEIEWVPLCDRPECGHTAGDCNAFIGDALNGISIYEDHIYYWREKDGMESGTDIYRLKLDGSGHEKYKELSAFNAMQLHRGTLYGNRITENGQEIWKIPLEGKEAEGEKILEAEYIGGGYFWGNSVIFSGAEQGQPFLYRYEPETEGDPYVWTDEIEGMLNYSVRNMTSERMYFLKEDGVYEYYFQDGKEKRLFDLDIHTLWDGKGWLLLLCDHEFIYIVKNDPEDSALVEKKLYIYDFSGKLMGTAEKKAKNSAVFFYNSTEDSIFLGGETEGYPWYRIRKEDLRKGKMEIVPLEKPKGRK